MMCCFHFSLKRFQLPGDCYTYTWDSFYWHPLLTPNSYQYWCHPKHYDLESTNCTTIQPFAYTHNRSRHPSIAVQHALIGVYDKLLHPPRVSCLLPIFTRIVCVVLSCFILLADSFTLVKFDDRYSDKWNDW